MTGRSPLRLRVLGRRPAWPTGRERLLVLAVPVLQDILGWAPKLLNGCRMRLPSLMYSSTARILSSGEYMNYLLVVQVFVCIPHPHQNSCSQEMPLLKMRNESKPLLRKLGIESQTVTRSGKPLILGAWLSGQSRTQAGAES